MLNNPISRIHGDKAHANVIFYHQKSFKRHNLFRKWQPFQMRIKMTPPPKTPNGPRSPFGFSKNIIIPQISTEFLGRNKQNIFRDVDDARSSTSLHGPLTTSSSPPSSYTPS